MTVADVPLDVLPRIIQKEVAPQLRVCWVRAQVPGGRGVVGQGEGCSHYRLGERALGRQQQTVVKRACERVGPQEHEAGSCVEAVALGGVAAKAVVREVLVAWVKGCRAGGGADGMDEELRAGVGADGMDEELGVRRRCWWHG